MRPPAAARRPPPLPACTALAALALALLAAGAHAARLAPAKNKKSSPDGVSFSTRASVTFGKGGSFGAGGRGGVVLQPAGCSTKCNGFTQSSGEEHTNEMYAFGLDRATLERGDAVDGTPGTPAAFMRVQLRNRGLAVPADAGMAIVNVTVRMTPVGLAGGDAPPGSEPFDVTFGVMWTPGAGSKPNAAALFSLVSPLPAVKFMAYGQPHEFSVRARALAPGGVFCAHRARAAAFFARPVAGRVRA